MCLGVPMKIVEIVSSYKAYAELMGVKRPVYTELIPDIEAGQYILVHAGFAIEILNEDEAEKRIHLFQEILDKEDANEKQRKIQ